MFRPEARRDQSELLKDLAETKRIVKASGVCAEEREGEPGWNSEVHAPLLRLALQRHEGVLYKNM